MATSPPIRSKHSIERPWFSSVGRQIDDYLSFTREGELLTITVEGQGDAATVSFSLAPR